MSDALVVLDKLVSFSFVIGANTGGQTLDRDGLRSAAQAMADSINALSWDPPYRRAFRAMNGIVFFVGGVPFGAASLTRPFSDQKNAVFYWQAGEFMQDWLPAWRATYYFHDCWHVIQFEDKGGASADLDEEIDREVDALTRQLEVARLLKCDATLINYLEGFRANRPAIEQRIAQGYTASTLCTACGAAKTQVA